MAHCVRVAAALLLAGWQVLVPGTRSVCLCLCARGSVCWDLDVPGFDCCKTAESYETGKCHGPVDGSAHGLAANGRHAWSANVPCGCKHLELPSAQVGAVRGAPLDVPDAPCCTALSVLAASLLLETAVPDCRADEPTAAASEARPLVLRC